MVWPLEGTSPRAAPDSELDRDGLAELYAHPEGVLRVNFVASADGAVAVDGVSVRARGPRRPDGLRPAARARRRGPGRARAACAPRATAARAPRPSARPAGARAARPPCRRSPSSAPAATSTRRRRLFTDTAVAPARAPHRPRAGARRQRARAPWPRAGAEVVDVGGDPGSTARRGARRPRRPGAVPGCCARAGRRCSARCWTAGRVDELCLSLAPQLVGGAAGRIVAGAASSGPRAAAPGLGGRPRRRPAAALPVGRAEETRPPLWSFRVTIHDDPAAGGVPRVSDRQRSGRPSVGRRDPSRSPPRRAQERPP